jgi:hypothetical protein
MIREPGSDEGEHVYEIAFKEGIEKCAKFLPSSTDLERREFARGYARTVTQDERWLEKHK